MAKLVIIRKKAWTARAAKFLVFIDNEKVGGVYNDATFEIEIPAGTHKLKCETWLKSMSCEDYEFMINENETVTVFVKPSNFNWAIIGFCFPFILFRPAILPILNIETNLFFLLYTIFAILLIFIFRKKLIEIKDFGLSV